MNEQELREKVIKGLECCMIPGNGGCDDCPYVGKGICQELLGEDALALLKAQEPVEPTIGYAEEHDGHDSWWYQCGKCEKPIYWHDNYCRHCGREAKWE